MAADQWKSAFLAVCLQSDFQPLTELLSQDHKSSGINEASIDWEGVFLTPLFVASLLRLEDQLPQLVAAGADPNVQCFYAGLFCSPLHGAALRGDVAVVEALLAAGGDIFAEAEASAVEGEVETLAHTLMGLHALHVLVAKDIYSEEVYRLLMRRGLRLSSCCLQRRGGEIPGLLLPRLLGNQHATEERLDRLLGEEVQLIIRSAGLAHDLNEFLEVVSVLRRDHDVTYRCANDIDFPIREPEPEGSENAGREEEAPTALLFAAQAGRCEAVRLLLYAGADAARSMRQVLAMDDRRVMLLQTQAVQLAVLRGDLVMVEQLLFFDISPDLTCSGKVFSGQDKELCEEWTGLSLLHLVVLSRSYDLVEPMKQLDCRLEAVAKQRLPDGTVTEVTPLHLAVLMEDAKGCTRCIDCGAEVTETIREAALQRRPLREMFGGSSPISLQDWVEAILMGPETLQELLEQRTDLNKAFAWPISGEEAKELLEGKALSSSATTERLVEAFCNGRTAFDGIRPVHLAVVLDQLWALQALLKAGAKLEGFVTEALLDPLENPNLQGLEMDLALLCVRAASLEMLRELRDEGLLPDVNYAAPLTPDMTPPFFPWQVDERTLPQPLWAWQGLAPLHLALLLGRRDVALLLVRLGANLLQTVDHVAIEAPWHYSVTDNCFRGLTPLHLCALLDQKANASALLGEASGNVPFVFPGEKRPPQNKEMLGAVCRHVWATLDSNKDSEKEEPWLWRDVTPLHLAFLYKSYVTAEALIEATNGNVKKSPRCPSPQPRKPYESPSF
ncbi:unnamed protein product [Symbiodinium natans]|uniref:Uncharacterized protein n=1 Tax=Symbiodinium natans TaxID=878477 RepID=A0A812NI22_9DINO|nr:unnamed protein product [Symbiodinium natans]